MAAPTRSSRSAASWAVTPGPPAWRVEAGLGGSRDPARESLASPVSRVCGPRRASLPPPSRGPGRTQPALAPSVPSLQPAAGSRDPQAAPKWRRLDPFCLGPRGPVPATAWHSPGATAAAARESVSLRSGTAPPLLPTRLGLLPARVGGARGPVGGAAAASPSAAAHRPGTPSPPRSAAAVWCVHARVRGKVGAARCGAADPPPCAAAAAATHCLSALQSPGCEDELCQTPTQK